MRCPRSRVNSRECPFYDVSFFKPPFVEGPEKRWCLHLSRSLRYDDQNLPASECPEVLQGPPSTRAGPKTAPNVVFARRNGRKPGSGPILTTALVRPGALRTYSTRSHRSVVPTTCEWSWLSMTRRRGSCDCYPIIVLLRPPRSSALLTVRRRRQGRSTTSLRGVEGRRETFTPSSTGTGSKVKRTGRLRSYPVAQFTPSRSLPPARFRTPSSFTERSSVCAPTRRYPLCENAGQSRIVAGTND